MSHTFESYGMLSLTLFDSLTSRSYVDSYDVAAPGEQENFVRAAKRIIEQPLGCLEYPTTNERIR